MRSKKLTISGAIILASVVLDASAIMLGPDVKNVLAACRT